MLYSIDEITLIPNHVSYISSRSMCETRRDGKLPLFVSPMSCLIDETNFSKFEAEGFNVILPRTVDWKIRMTELKKGRWIAVGFKEAKHLYDCWESEVNRCGSLDFVPHILIDQAQGHLVDLLDLCADLKKMLGKNGIRIMTGNIASPDTYLDYAVHGIDYVRCSVGTGHGCTTSCQTGFNYPMGSLLIDIQKVKENAIVTLFDGEMSEDCIYTLPKIIADGGFDTNAQIIKALALGADYVMLGEIVGRSVEACGPKVEDDSNFQYDDDFVCTTFKRLYYGMSTHRAQCEINQAACFPVKDFRPKRAEGIEKFIPVDYKISIWVNAFETDLKSGMSYANAETLSQFIGRVKWDVISHDSYMKFMGKLSE